MSIIASFVLYVISFMLVVYHQDIGKCLVKITKI